ncbi:MAG: class II aldolase/adducin family protein [Pyrinomonadaceae bacterium]|nr:class II aldolase/adducin family protein [Pyrinomonadaceae bacterium]
MSSSLIDEQSARREIVQIGRLLCERGYVVSSDGNLSVRLSDDRIIATPTMMSKGRMTEDALAVTDLEGKPFNDRRASSELKMHLLIYRERSDVKAVCHAHPAHSTAFAVAGLSIDEPILSEVILALGCVPLAAYGTPSTDELTDAMQPLVKHHNALLMANHGAVAYGENLWQAFDRLETMEHTARITILARSLGGSRTLPPDAIEKLINVRERAGYLSETARCQACGYLSETGVACSTDDGGKEKRTSSSGANLFSHTNGAGKVTLTREELVELLYEASRVKS